MKIFIPLVLLILTGCEGIDSPLANQIAEVFKTAPVVKFKLSSSSGDKAVFEVKNPLSGKGGSVQLFTDKKCTQQASSVVSFDNPTIKITADDVQIDSTVRYYIKYINPEKESYCLGSVPVNYKKRTFSIQKNTRFQVQDSLGQIGSGTDYSCVVTASGGVKCWGNGEDGRLGNGADNNVNYPMDVIASQGSSDLLSNIVQISVGAAHTCALTSSGGVKCWGKGEYGRLGNGVDNNVNYPVDVIASQGSTDLLSNVVQVSAGVYHTCALTSSGNVKCWGSGLSGELGNGANGDSADTNYPVDVIASSGSTSPLSDVSQINVGRETTCALTSLGGVKCWGKGGSGELGNGANGNTTYPVDVIASSGNTLPLSDIVQINGGSSYMCALTSSEKVKCWGFGMYGRLGSGSDHSSNTPVDVIASKGSTSLLSDVVQINGGSTHTCALISSGRVKCWGRRKMGQLGDGNALSQYTNAVLNPSYNGAYISWPVDVIASQGSTSLLSEVVQIGTGEDRNCVLMSSGRVKCWGVGNTGSLGNGQSITANHPVDVIASNGNTSLLQAGCYPVGYSCSNNTCSLDTNAIALSLSDMSTPSQPVVRIHHVSSGDTVSLHDDKSCEREYLASDTATGDTLDLTTSVLVFKDNIFYVKRNDVCLDNSISYQYGQGLETPSLDLAVSITKVEKPSIKLNISPLDKMDNVALYKKSDCSDDPFASVTFDGTDYEIAVLSQHIKKKFSFYLKKNEHCFPSPWVVSYE